MNNKEKKTHSMKARGMISDVIVHVVLALLAIVWVIPVLWIALLSFSTQKGSYVTSFFPKGYTLHNYVRLFTDTQVLDFPQMFKNTFIIAVFSCLISTIFVLSVSYCMSRMRFKIRKTYMNIAMILGLFPAFMSMVAVYYILKAVGLSEGSMIRVALILVYSGGSGAGFLLAKGFFDTVPKALDESDLSARHVSELLYVSEASLSRFAKKCGYTGYREFVYRYQEGLNAALPGTDDHIKQVLNTYQELLNKSYSLADRAQIDRICHILTSKRRVYVYGLGSSGLSAQEMKLRFMLAGVDIEAITDIHIMKMNAVLLNESCAAIGITVSGQTPEVLRALGAAKEKGASTILFTSRSSSDYDAFCDEVLLLAVKEHLKNGGAISPQFPILVMIDVLYSHFLTTDSERKEALYEYAVTKLHET